MTLSAGTRLGTYEILAPLGAGGMGEVYRARDSKLSREVAIKVLPADLARDAAALARFEREAKAVAALSHPNILAIHDFGTHENTTYAVMELLEGESLQQRLTEGPLPLRKTLEVARDVALGLAAAHEKGIVHRDLKPANLFLTRDGRVKILDFGLARQVAPPSADDTNSPTVGQASEPGFIVGTVGYMAPEQLKGQPADARSDIFSFGAVLYEMLSGERAFRGDSAIATMNAILKEDPPSLSESGRQIPPALERIVGHCLEKNPAERFQSARDLAFDLDSASGGSSSSMAAARAPSRRVPILAVLLALAVAAIPAAVFVGRGTVRYQPPSFQQLTFRRGIILHARYTPDGGSVIYGASWEGGPSEIFTARLDGTESRPFGVKNADVLAVSSKGEVAILLKNRSLKSIAGNGTLAIMPLGGGAHRDLLEHVFGADWSPDGTQLAVARLENDEFRLEYPASRVLYKSKNLFGPVMRVSETGKQIAFLEFTPLGNDLRIVDVTGKSKTLAHVDSTQIFNGLVWRRGDQEILFSLISLKDKLSDIDVVDMSGRIKTLYRGTGDLFAHDSLADGRLLLGQAKSSVDLLFGSSKEPSEKNLGWLANSFLGDLSEDGETVLFDDDTDIYLRRTDGAPAVHLGAGHAGSLSPDGRWVLATSDSEHEISMIPTGPGHARKISIGELVLGSFGFMPDGKSILFSATAKDGRVRLYVTDETGKATRVVSEPGQPRTWAASLDSREVAVGDGENGLKIYRLDGGAPRTIPGFDPADDVLAWTADGRFLYVDQGGTLPRRVERFDLVTGRKELWKTLVPPDAAGAYKIGAVAVTRDGRFWAYSAERQVFSELWQVTGLATR